MKVSVILTVINEGPGMAELLDALLAQSRAPDEIVVVDGGSKDDTVAVLSSYSERYPLLKVHVEPGVNIARGRNIAIERAAGDVLAVTDGGCRPEADWLRELVRPLESDPTVGAVAGRFVPVSHNRFEYFCGKVSVPDLAQEAAEGMFFGRSSAFRRNLWEAVGGYPEWLYTAEDTLFAVAAQRAGFKVAYAPESILHWRPRPTLSKLFKMYYLYGRGNGRINRRDVKGSLYWLRYYLILVLSLAAGIFQPWFLLVSAAAAVQLWRLVVLPNLKRYVPKPGESPERYFYVPLMVLTRNLATSIGYVRGWLEYRQGGDYQSRLDQYLRAAESR
jgi:cellulose synthase/poly-beta-1,6-N-acetylglucosamine synthase-like glycosyltransferase